MHSRPRTAPAECWPPRPRRSRCRSPRRSRGTPRARPRCSRPTGRHVGAAGLKRWGLCLPYAVPRATAPRLGREVLAFGGWLVDRGRALHVGPGVPDPWLLVKQGRCSHGTPYSCPCAAGNAGRGRRFGHDPRVHGGAAAGARHAGSRGHTLGASGAPRRRPDPRADGPAADGHRRNGCDAGANQPAGDRGGGGLEAGSVSGPTRLLCCARL